MSQRRCFCLTQPIQFLAPITSSSSGSTISRPTFTLVFSIRLTKIFNINLPWIITLAVIYTRCTTRQRLFKNSIFNFSSSLLSWRKNELLRMKVEMRRWRSKRPQKTRTPNKIKGIKMRQLNYQNHSQRSKVKDKQYRPVLRTVTTTKEVFLIQLIVSLLIFCSKLAPVLWMANYLNAPIFLLYLYYIVPIRQAGICYQEQEEILLVANLALSDQL